MDVFTHLWLPMLASAAAVWIASALGWMIVNHHSKDFGGLPNEAAAMEQMRPWGLAPGVYGFPFTKKSECNTPEAKAKWEKGPCGMIRIWGPINMGANMGKSLAINLIVSVLIGYLGWSALPHMGASFAKVFQVLGTAGVLAYCFGGLPGDIWFQQSRRAMVMNFIDGIVFGLITGAVFAAMWPKA